MRSISFWTGRFANAANEPIKTPKTLPCKHFLPFFRIFVLPCAQAIHKRWREKNLEIRPERNESPNAASPKAGTTRTDRETHATTRTKRSAILAKPSPSAAKHILREHQLFTLWKITDGVPLYNFIADDSLRSSHHQRGAQHFRQRPAA